MQTRENPSRPFLPLLLAVGAWVLFPLFLSLLEAWALVISVPLIPFALLVARDNLRRGDRKLVNMAAILLSVAWILHVAVLLMLPFPGVGRERARRTGCASNLKQIGYGVHLYSSDHNEKFPENLPVLYEQNYIKNHKVFICPSGVDAVAPFTPGEPLTEDHVSYCYISCVQPSDPPAYVVAFDEESNHDGDGVNVLFTGGNVRWINDLAELHETLVKQRQEMRATGRTMTIIRPAWSDAPEDKLSRR